ncbi:MAG TPA: hypothetical protein VH186_16655 [Chloroflexia bacterium]|nr:hypothetical protein [Chloroflexia bacterium]
MPVIINDFEIVSSPPPEKPATPSGQSENRNENSAKPSPALELLWRRQQERLLRVQAC